MTDILIMFLSGIGAIAILLASIGILRMPDFYHRLSVTTKAATLGVGLILVAGAFYFQNVGVTSRVLAIILFTTLTAPVSAQLIGRAAYLVKTKMWKHTIIDELDGMYDTATDTLHGMDVPNKDEPVIKP
ncbi:MAG TPA: monovalent cation/H(+) antiporter subunit G [Flavisolibacter sp.]|nr:monovalent cation/H(+) antiporter subunit G [Flavisolibacter sp.]